MKDSSYITIQSWMRTELNLSGNDLLVYAIIYGFSQDGQSKFNGSLQYLADWCGATKQGIQKNLKNLIDKGLIAKEESNHNHVKYCKYSCIPYNSVAYHETEFNAPIQHSCINNIVNTIEENNIDYIKEKIDQPKRKTLYEKCIDEINLFTNNVGLNVALTDYLDVRLKMTDKKLYGVNQWKGLLNKLLELSNDVGEQIDIVNTATERGWASFFKPNYSRGNSVFGEDEQIKSTSRKEKFSDETF